MKWKQLTPEEAVDRQLARDQAMRWLARREYASAELGSRLSARGFSRDIVSAVVTSLQAERLLNDERFADLQRDSLVQRGYGPVRIRQVLREKGVDSATTEALLTSDQIDWREVAHAVRRKKFARMPDDRKSWLQQARFLEYRGFPHDLICRVLGDEDEVG